MFKAKSFLLVIIILCSYLYFSNPAGRAIFEDGKVGGLSNKGREVLQNGKFWKLQLERANERYNENLSPGESMASLMRESDQLSREFQKEMDNTNRGLYSPEEKKAESLRRKADSIEKAESYLKSDERSEKYRLDAIKTCKIIIPIIEARLLDVKTSYTPLFLLICIFVFASLFAISKHQKNLARKNRYSEYSEFDVRNFWNINGAVYLIFMVIGWFFLTFVMIFVGMCFNMHGPTLVEDTTLLSILIVTVVAIFMFDQLEKV